MTRPPRPFPDPRATYDPDADAIGIYFAPAGAQPADSVEIAPGLTVDYDQHNRVVGVEILGVRALLDTGRTPPAKASHLQLYDIGPLDAVLDRYSKTFPGQLPHVLGLGPEDEPVAVALMEWAMARGKALDGWQIMSALGIEEPPDGAVL
ncbi:DUF2283 domain-containing protein [Paracraurococcus ruber]|uniref:DUF2283 domain-containing protein n=1 Tax=Paracraurococcus ruber TaxID=77675 RepID=A0ABS1D4U1_9PROT|nr:DUF2283 domain-containing protein [Paracraurococcus ruber]MBK1661871.1 hypothetical protein [Paracraurococcus ruber]TDG16843.1 DUF2283 domain-containing protein [Paracraurococcus ruber]